jgi:putative ABC transport system substrate-binding protein
MAQKRLDDSNIGTALQQVGRKTVAQRVQRHALTARAQQGERMRRIGVLMSNVESDPEVQTWMAAFREGLRKLGWVQDRNIRIDARWGAADYERLRIYAAELSRLAPDVIFAGATPALVALQRETSSLPIVFTQVSDPVKLGLIASLARPGGNITGFAIVEHAIAGKWLELLKDTASGTTRILVLSDPNTPSHGPYVQAIESAAPSFGVQLTLADVRSSDEIERAVNAFAQQPNGALIVVPNPVTILHRDLIFTLAARHRLPAVYPYRFFASSGGFISYGTDITDQYRQAATYVDRILKGQNPGELPVQLPTKYDLVVNLKTAKALGITVPISLLVRADEVIE